MSPRRITPERFYSVTWLETKEAERKAEERWHFVGIMAGSVLACVLAWVAFAVVVGP